MTKLLEKYLLRSVLREGDGVGAPAPVAPAPAPAAPAADPAPAPAPAPAGTLLTAAAAAVKEPVKADPAAAPEWKEYAPDTTKTPEENAALKAEHDKGKPAEPKAKEEPAKTDDEKAADLKAAAEAFKLEVPDGFELNKAIEGQFRTFAAKRGLDQEAVNELRGMQLKMYEEQQTAFAEQVAGWGESIKADKELGGPSIDAKMGKAGAAINEFFSPDVASMLDKTGLGNHPEFVRGFYRIGLAMGEMPTFRANANAGGRENILDVLYGAK